MCCHVFDIRMLYRLAGILSIAHAIMVMQHDTVFAPNAAQIKWPEEAHPLRGNAAALPAPSVSAAASPVISLAPESSLTAHTASRRPLSLSSMHSRLWPLVAAVEVSSCAQCRRSTAKMLGAESMRGRKFPTPRAAPALLPKTGASCGRTKDTCGIKQKLSKAETDTLHIKDPS